jgi:hypothetical protein
MEKYGWTYEDYLNTPIHILNLAHRKLETEAKLAAKAAEQPQ